MNYSSPFFEYFGLRFQPISKTSDILLKVKSIFKTCDKACSYSADCIGASEKGLLLFNCEICHSKWLVCFRCSSQRAKFVKCDQVMRHLKERHKEQGKNKSVSSMTKNRPFMSGIIAEVGACGSSPVKFSFASMQSDESHPSKQQSRPRSTLVKSLATSQGKKNHQRTLEYNNHHQRTVELNTSMILCAMAKGKELQHFTTEIKTTTTDTEEENIFDGNSNRFAPSKTPDNLGTKDGTMEIETITGAEEQNICNGNSNHVASSKKTQNIFDGKLNHVAFSKLPENWKEFPFETEREKKFFFNVSRHEEQEKRAHACIEYLVACAVYEICFLPSNLNEGRDLVSQSDANLYINLAKMTFWIPRSDRSLLSEIIEGVYQRGLHDGFHSGCDEINLKLNEHLSASQIPVDFINNKIAKNCKVSPIAGSIRLPLKETDLRAKILDGKHSILSSLPLPQIHKDVEGHARVDPIDCCRYFLSLINSKFTCLNDLTGFDEPNIYHSSQSRKAKEIYQEARSSKFDGIVSYLTFWSDDCDAGSMSMMGLANMWIMTMTIATTLNDGNCFQNTFPIALGKKGISHDGIYAKLASSLSSLRDLNNENRFYIGSHNKMAKCYFATFACLGDQPERRGEVGLRLASSIYCARWKVSANHGEMYKHLKACCNCKEKLQDMYDTCHLWSEPKAIPSCSDCLNWDALCDSPLSLTALPKEYPRPEMYSESLTHERWKRIVQRDGGLFLKPFVITFKSLKDAVRIAHESYIDERVNWSLSECEAFLKVEGLNTAFIDLFKKNTQIHEDTDEFVKATVLSAWCRPGIDLDCYIDCIMHLLFLGVVEDCMTLTQTLMAEVGLTPKLTEMVGTLTLQLFSFKCDWMKMKQYKGGKFAGWISDNYLAVARASQWVYQNMACILQEKKDWRSEPDPSYPQEKWKKKDNEIWLKKRGLYTKGNAKELSQRVKEYMCQDPVPPIVNIPKVEDKDFERLWSALVRMLQCAMSREVNDIVVSKLKFAVRLFLSAFDDLEKKLPKSSTNDLPKSSTKGSPNPGGSHAVIRKGNFLCLMNLPEEMAKYGPLMDLWEGKIQGEGYLPTLKDRYYGGLRDNWEYNMLNGLYRDRCLEDVTSQGNKNRNSKTDKFNLLKVKSSSYYEYSCTFQVLSFLNEKKNQNKVPISVVLLIDDADDQKDVRIFAVAGDRNHLVEIFWNKHFPVSEKFGLVYYKFDANEQSTSNEVLTWHQDIAPKMMSPRLGFAYLLPLLDNIQTDSKRLFAMIGSNWQTLTRNNSMKNLVEKK